MRLIFFLLAFAAVNSCNMVSDDTSSLKPPSPKKIAKIFKEHGDTRTDDYFWMNDSKDSAVINHLDAENAYTASYLKHTEELQKKIYDELVARIDQKFESLPSKKNGYWYYSRFEEGKQYPFYCRRKESLSAPEEVVLNIPQM